MLGKTAIVGDGDSITVFKAAGVDAFPAQDEKKAREVIRRSSFLRKNSRGRWRTF